MKIAKYFNSRLGLNTLLDSFRVKETFVWDTVKPCIMDQIDLLWGLAVRKLMILYQERNE